MEKMGKLWGRTVPNNFRWSNCATLDIRVRKISNIFIRVTCSFSFLSRATSAITLVKTSCELNKVLPKMHRNMDMTCGYSSPSWIRLERFNSSIYLPNNKTLNTYSKIFGKIGMAVSLPKPGMTRIKLSTNLISITTPSFFKSPMRLTQMDISWFPWLRITHSGANSKCTREIYRQVLKVSVE